MVSLESEWVFESSLEPLWQALSDLPGWPCWWPGLGGVEMLNPGDCYGVGSLYRLVWKVGPHLQSVEAQVTEVIEPHLLEIHTGGFLPGYQSWGLKEEGAYTLVHRTWMGSLEAGGNQKVLMVEAARALSEHLGLRLIECGSWTQAAPQVWLEAQQSRS